MQKNTIIGIIGLVIGFIVLPILALISFGVVSTISVTLKPTSTSGITSSMLCMGTDESTGQSFTGNIANDDSGVCLLISKNNEIQLFDSKINSANKGTKIIEDYKSQINSNTEKFNVQDNVLLVFRILLYSIVCLIPFTIIASFIFLITGLINKR